MKLSEEDIKKTTLIIEDTQIFNYLRNILRLEDIIQTSTLLMEHTQRSNILKEHTQKKNTIRGAH